MEKVITTNQISYPQIRNFVDVPHSFKFREERDVFTTLLNQYFRVFNTAPPFYKNLHFYPLPNKVRFRHFFNAISFNKTPWIVTFETTLPRLGNAPQWIYKEATKRLASDSCKKIIALSQNSYDLQVNYLKENYPNYLASIQEKMVILHPPQKLLIKGYSEKNLPDDKIIFTFVGADFFRKGGREILNVFDRLLPDNPHLKLNIVSAMHYGDYASKTTIFDFEKAMETINKYPNNIKLYKSLSNKEVLVLFKNSHIGLLPTWGDTYGYSVLEAQASGCPVISTDLRALSEINNSEIGWVIPIPKKQSGDAINDSQEDRIKLSSVIESSLESIFKEIILNNYHIQAKAEKGLQRIRDDHDPFKNAITLKQFYTG